MVEEIKNCLYSECEKDTLYSPRKGVFLCEEHFKLYSFIAHIIGRADVIINLWKEKGG